MCSHSVVIPVVTYVPCGVRVQRDNDDSPRNGGVMDRQSSFPPSQSSFPPSGFLILGVLSIAASIVFVVRAVAVEATAERIWSAVIFGTFGFFWLAAYWSARRHPSN